MRINVFISSKGICSRREADRFIEQGKVTVNGLLAKTGMEINADDVVMFQGRVLKEAPKRFVIALHKPIGIECTTDSAKPDNIVAFVGHPERIFPIGRLDKDSSGLILLTNDGSIVNAILRSENEHDKEYSVVLEDPFDDAFLDRLRAGVEIYNPVRHEKTVTKQALAKRNGPNQFSLTITQGLNLQIRRMVTALGNHVKTLSRSRIMHIRLGELPVGKWRYLSAEEARTLYKTIGIDESVLSLN